MGKKIMNKNLGSYTSSVIIIGTSLILSGCSSSVTRFDYPAMGYNSSESDNSIFGDANSYTTPSRSDRSYGNGVADAYDSASNKTSRQNPKVASYNRGSVQSESVQELSAPSRQPRTYRPRRISNFGAGKPAYKAAKSYSQNNGSANGTTVRVVSGDTLYSISRRYGLKPADFMAANNMADSTVRLGQVLKVPGKGGRTVVASAKTRAYRPAAKPASTFQYASDRSRKSAASHTVQSNDTLYSVARKYGVSYVQLAQWNGLDQNAGLRIGQKLSLKAGVKPTRRVARLKDSGTRSDAGTPGLWNKRAAKKAVAAKVVVAAPVKLKKVAALKTVRKVAPKRKTGGFRWPVRGRIITKFGPMANGKNNDGVNFAVPMGTEVKAADNGVVAYAGSELKGYGNLVLIRHANNFVSAYAHNSRLKVKRGDRIKRGQVVALVGKSGDVSQPQLHFELRKGSKPIDPMQYMSQ